MTEKYIDVYDIEAGATIHSLDEVMCDRGLTPDEEEENRHHLNDDSFLDVFEFMENNGQL
jgi:hypothetical protein